jgi:hypothetical protein
MSTKKKHRGPSPYARKMLGFIDDYIAETGDQEVDHHHVAAWAIRKGRWESPTRDQVQILARDLSRAAREDFIEDENGQAVRRRHSYKVVQGEFEYTKWVKIEDASPDQMKLSVQGRRRGILSDCIQLNRDVKHYNKNYNPGEYIQPSFDFGSDIAEAEQSGEYDDTPPEE